MPRWRPLLAGADARRAREAIAQAVAHLTDDAPDGSLMRGHAGVALLHAYRARAGEAGAAEATAGALGRALDWLQAGSPGPWLASGLAGVGFSLEHVRDVVRPDERLLGRIDALIAGAVARADWPFECELLFGLVGLGVYALERRPRPRAMRILDRVRAHLRARAERAADGAAWRSSEELFHLGMAHGVAGVAAFLGRAGARGLARAGSRWIRARDAGGRGQRFPMVVGAEPRRVLDGWCSGDLGIAAALAAVGERAAGVALARQAARRPIAAGVTSDDKLCHGDLGRAHILNRLAQASGDAALATEARRHYRRTLDAFRPDAGGEPGFLSGASGVALGLLAAVTPVEPRWDRALLLDLRPAARAARRGAP